MRLPTPRVSSARRGLRLLAALHSLIWAERLRLLAGEGPGFWPWLRRQVCDLSSKNSTGGSRSALRLSELGMGVTGIYLCGVEGFNSL